MRRRKNGFAQLSGYRKSTWNDQYNHFHSFVLLKVKRNLTCFLADKARKMCTGNAIENELRFFRSVFVQNGYFEGFINKTTRRRKGVRPVNKPVYVRLSFKGETEAEGIQRSLADPISRTFLAAQLKIVLTSKPIMFPIRGQTARFYSLIHSPVPVGHGILAA